LREAVEDVIADRIAGSPVDASIRWTNQSPAAIADAVAEQGFEVGVDTMREILSGDLGLSRRQAVKIEASVSFPQRDEQFQHIAWLRDLYWQAGWPVISIDTKKKELLGNFYRAGGAWTDGWVRVQDHDFVTSAQRLVPYGVYDVHRDEGLMLLTRGADSSLLACDGIGQWWNQIGRFHYLNAPRMLILCDCGGSNGYRLNRFKQDLCGLACRLGIELHVSHYPPGCSKYNPIEHRLFCHVSRALQSVVLKSIETARDLIATTSTSSGLKVIAKIARKTYEKGRKATRQFLDDMPIRFSTVLPKLNYTAPAT
jgi:Rhodopirellula transposase DDE domain